MAKKKVKKAKKHAQRASPIERADVAIATEAVKFRKAPLVRALDTVAKLADQPPLLALSAGTLALGLVLRRPKLVRTGARMLASELVATGMKGVLKRRIDRTRPHKMLEDGRYAFREAHGGESDGAWSSFPSGHTAGAVAVGRAIAREVPEAAPAAGVAAAAVGAVQLPSGSHFPTDVATGAAIGLAAEAIVDGAAKVAAAAAKSPD